MRQTHDLEFDKSKRTV